MKNLFFVIFPLYLYLFTDFLFINLCLKWFIYCLCHTLLFKEIINQALYSSSADIDKVDCELFSRSKRKKKV